MEKITKSRDDIEGKVKVVEGEGYKPKTDVVKWIEDVQKLENEWEAMQESIYAAKTLTYKCCPKCSLRSEVSTQAQNIRDQLCGLKQVVESFRSNLVVEKYLVKKVEFIPGPLIEDQLTATRQMKTDVKIKVYTLDEDESWQLFAKNVGDIVNLAQNHPLAKEIARECDGLPLAIIVIGSSMRGQTRFELWEDALKSLRMSEPHSKVVEDTVYKVIKWNFDSFGSQDIESSSEQKRQHVNKKREEFLGEHDTYEEAYNRGITMIERLKDACLLESHGMDSAKINDEVRDVTRWIANYFGDEHNPVFQAGIGLTEISHIKVSASVKKISFASSNISHLPDNFMKCPETTTLLLQGNHHLWEIPHEFFLAFPALIVLNLSQTSIRASPSSINCLYQLRALILKNSSNLNELPPIGNLCNLRLVDCDKTSLNYLPQGIEKLTNLRLLNLPEAYLKEIICQGFFLKFASIEMLNMKGICVGSTSLDERITNVVEGTGVG
ncbi:putative disease resistance protein-like [Capsicum annuum]|nr:putative disease resistance protein-like [Capsicum annuum]